MEFRIAILVCLVLLFACANAAVIKPTHVPDAVLNHNSNVNVDVDFDPPVKSTTGDKKATADFGPDAFAPPVEHTPEPKSTDLESRKAVSKDSDGDKVNTDVEFDDGDDIDEDGRKMDAMFHDNKYVPTSAEKNHGKGDRVNVNVEVDDVESPTDDVDGRKMNTMMDPKSYAPPGHKVVDDGDDHDTKSNAPSSPQNEQPVAAISPPRRQRVRDTKKDEMMVLVLDYSRS